MSLLRPCYLSSLMLARIALLLIPLLGIAIAATKARPIRVRGSGAPGQLRPRAAIGDMFSGICAGAGSNDEHMSNRARLELILDSLLPNALKQSPGGGAVLSHATPDNVQLVPDVADTCPGNFMKKRPVIIAASYSGGAPESSQLKGTRIGTSMVPGFVRPHLVPVRSSTVRLVVPVSVCACPWHPGSRASRHSAAL